MLRYLRLFGIQVRTSLVLGMQYRWEFLIDGALSVFWAAAAVLPARRPNRHIPAATAEQSGESSRRC